MSVRNYGVFVGEEVGSQGSTANNPPKLNGGLKKALISATDTSFRNYDLRYADSDLSVSYGLDVKSQMKTFGAHGATSRFAEWKLEYEGYVKSGKAPGFTLLRLPRDHTAGTATGQ